MKTVLGTAMKRIKMNSLIKIRDRLTIASILQY